MKGLFSSQLRNRFIINDLKVHYIILILHSSFPIKSVCGKRPAQAKILFYKYTTVFFGERMLTLPFNMHSKDLLSFLKKHSTYPIIKKARINVYFTVC